MADCLFSGIFFKKLLLPFVRVLSKRPGKRGAEGGGIDGPPFYFYG